MEKIQLNQAIKIDGVSVHELSLRRPKVRDLVVSNKEDVSEAEREVRLISNLLEIPVDTVHELDLGDYMKIQERLKDFLSPAQKTTFEKRS